MTLPTFKDVLPTGRDCKGIDGMTGAGANQLCNMIRNYWRSHGYEVPVRAVYDTTITDLNRQRLGGTVLSTGERMVIRSDMIGGLPREAYNAAAARADERRAIAA